MKRAVIVFACAWTLGGCAGSVTLRHPDGRMVECGGGQRVFDPAIGFQRERGCIEDFQRQGFERMP